MTTVTSGTTTPFSLPGLGQTSSVNLPNVSTLGAQSPPANLFPVSSSFGGNLKEFNKLGLPDASSFLQTVNSSPVSNTGARSSMLTTKYTESGQILLESASVGKLGSQNDSAFKGDAQSRNSQLGAKSIFPFASQVVLK